MIHAAMVKGWKELDKKLEMLADPKRARKAIRTAVNYSLTPVVQTARRNVPKGDKGHKTYKGRLVAPGFASRSIKKKVKIIGQSIVGRVGLAKEAFYALFFETGTKNLPKDPWLERSFDENKNKMVQRFGDSMRKSIKKIAKK